METLNQGIRDCNRGQEPSCDELEWNSIETVISIKRGSRVSRGGLGGPFSPRFYEWTGTELEISV